IGLDKVMISLDSIDKNLHNQNRDSNDAYEKAINAVSNAEAAGLDIVIQHVVTHQNAQSENTVKLAKFAQEKGFSLDVVIAKALGEWEGKHEVLIDNDDAIFLKKLNQQYPAARRDVFSSFGMKGGCGALRSSGVSERERM
ncbi:MAG: hypothetical protein WCL39_10915, partial [Armatimonadota bacterium]